MADSLERAKLGETWTVAETIEDRLTHVALRLFDLGVSKPEIVTITESIRKDIITIRRAIQTTWMI